MFERRRASTGKCKQILSFLWIYSHLLKRYFTFCAEVVMDRAINNTVKYIRKYLEHLRERLLLVSE